MERPSALSLVVHVENGARPESPDEDHPGVGSGGDQAPTKAFPDLPALQLYTSANAGPEQAARKVESPNQYNPEQDPTEDPVQIGLVDVGLYPSRSTTPPSAASVTLGSLCSAHVDASPSRSSSEASGAWWKSTRWFTLATLHRATAYSG